jgi:hypothetical protein
VRFLVPTTTFTLFVFNVALGIGLFYAVNRAGDLARPVGYTDFISVYKTNAFGLNVAFRAFAPTIGIGLVAAILYGLALGSWVEGIWLSVVFYWVYRLAYYLVRGWLPLLPKGTLFAQVTVSIAATYYFYSFMISRGPATLLPEAKDVTFQFWAIVIGFTYAVLQAREPGSDGDNPPLRALIVRYRALRSRFEPSLNERFAQDIVLQNLLFTVMLMEDFNRSSIVRGVERALVRIGKAQTTGIMQVTSPGRALSDEESVELAQDRLAEIFDDWYSEYLNQENVEPVIRQDPARPHSYSYLYGDLAFALPASELYRDYSGSTLSHADDVYLAISEDAFNRLNLGHDSTVRVALHGPEYLEQHSVSVALRP